MVSNMKHRWARLRPYNGPFFPEAVNSLRRELDLAPSVSGEWIKNVAPAVSGFDGATISPVTSDGYNWFWALFFRRDTGVTVVLIPMSQDWKKRDGTQSDRRIAVHTSDMTAQAAGEVVDELAKAVRERRLQDAALR
jgi:hypothetical protein